MSRFDLDNSMEEFTDKEIMFLKKLNTPAKIQDYLNSIPVNFERDGKDSAKSPLVVMRANSAHCIEGAMLGAYIFSLHGHKPILMHLKTENDWDHIVAPFKINERWGALSKTNHAVLRYREPVYKSPRELAMSYFHEYFDDTGRKTLRSYSRLVNLNSFEKGWECLDGDLWGIDEELENCRHYDIAPKNTLKSLRFADKIEIKTGKIVEYKK